MNMFFKSPIDIEILLDGEESRKHVEVPASTGSGNALRKESLPLIEDGESLKGIVTLRVREGKRVEHLGVKISVVGSIDMQKVGGVTPSSASKGSSASSNASNYSATDSKKKQVDQFLYLSYDLCPPGELQHSQSFPFAFKDLAKMYESYRGKNVDVSYYIKVTVTRKSTDISKLKRFWVYLYNDISKTPNNVTTTKTGTRKIINEYTDGGNGDKSKPKETGSTSEPQENGNEQSSDTLTSQENGVVPKPVKLDIGIDNCLHIEFEYVKSQYTLKDVIVGRIYFLLTRLRVKYMELSLITRESSGVKQNSVIIDTTSIRFEIMDGSPVKGETIPIRLFLGGYDLTPNMSCNYFTVKNYLSLVIIDEDGRRYFKQSEVVLYRTR
ncbi:similar to Saccharomyces cerevisiae YJL053W PEP8 Vacuolar protein sorting protein that forms part of the multimeric membrane-associated retromer complex along with Vps35p [Maudiozyma saulgeensis]|uniref:Similar to Saccharomyces cerevisiae YJL053W PEP8 Vacuolar protein sorting protein that forms part of the multimeric membrane-associated retromer complex along with Vps35p n=1 Tax=Maudiozyma saulgeensis TaxID=1789683 RepID=A0A1X7R4L7_9SACH|nr:similar to Saccharomyces cerevisiae YJL053W PEP8 Vacuolar protein sorting protein that forms part of the multimeric membrane-associated retromer complex along with Vps35p [Kazachstania saulgeensis]